MKYLLRLYHFLGSVSFAIFLITATALFVILGTFIEALTQSHLNASAFTYGTSGFLLLLFGFFLNILISALRRWPYRKRHIPFLITHLGLLMILAGVMVKAIFGVQGTLLVTEGSGSHDLFINNTEALRLEQKGSGAVAFVPLRYTSPEISFQLIKRVEHSQERLIPWFFGNRAIIRGVDPLPIYLVDEAHPIEKIPPSGQIRFFPENPIYSHVYALTTRELDNTLHTLYSQEASIRITDTVSQKDLGKFPLKELLQGSVATHLSNGTRVALSADLNLEHHAPALRVSLHTTDRESLLNIPLNGPQALLNLNETTPYLGSLPITVDIEMNPFLALIEDLTEARTCVLAVDPHGAVWQSIDGAGAIDQVLSYDEGFAGYSIQKTIPWKAETVGRQEKEAALHQSLAAHVEQMPMLIEPLQEFQAACLESQAPFGSSFVAFLAEWNRLNTWLYPSTAPLPKTIQPIFESLAAQWSDTKREIAFLSNLLFAFYDPQLQKGIDPLVMLTKERWPLTHSIKSTLAENPKTEEHPQQTLTLLTQQIIEAAQQAPLNDSFTLAEAATGFSALLRAHGFAFSKVLLASTEEKIGNPLILETPLKKSYLEKPPLVKLEDNVPAITLLVKTPQGKETLHLTFDKKGAGLCWPCGQGNYLIRYQPQVVAIPYHLRLRQARQINYPDSTQPYSYEADLLIQDLRTGAVVEKTISMNHVHETDDHYRFYLSAIYPPGEGVVKTVQIVANQDPAKYWLTYPGALILSIGIISLFVMKYREGKNK